MVCLTSVSVYKIPPQTPPKKNMAGTYRKILSFFHPNDSARDPSRKDFKIKKILGTPCSSWKLFIIKQFWTYADHTPEILHGYQKYHLSKESPIPNHWQTSRRFLSTTAQETQLHLNIPRQAPSQSYYSFSSWLRKIANLETKLIFQVLVFHFNKLGGGRVNPTLNHIWKEKPLRKKQPAKMC